jgi:NAD(P)-dependent dehydrogenase (short-subunit alcohol dehydrogenase family)
MKYAIVTGGARGLGLGIVRALLTDKVVDRIAVIDRALAPAPPDVADRVEGFNGDVTDETQIHAVVETITAKFGPHPDVLCNNAGGGESGWFESGRDAEWHSVEIWRRYVELNLNSVYIVSREIVPRMVAGGAVCNTSSIAGMLATPFLAAYAAAKAAVISYTRTLALQVGPKGIRGQCSRTRPDLHEDLGRAGRGDWRRRRAGTRNFRHDGAHADSAGSGTDASRYR